MRTEKTIAIVLAFFNSLTNLLMLLAAWLFLMMIPDAKGSEILVIIVGIFCIVYSFGFNFFFLKNWFYIPYDKATLMKLWVAAIVHYFLFIVYLLGATWLLSDGAFTFYGAILFIVFPLILSIAGLLFNIDNEAKGIKEFEQKAQSIETQIDAKIQPQTPKDVNPPISVSPNLLEMNSTESNPTNNGSGFHRLSQWLKESLAVKLFSIGFLVLMLIIPNAMIKDLIRERQSRQEEVKNEVSHSWGGSQAIQGPVLTVPYSTWTAYDDGKRTEERHTAYFLPQNLKVDGDLKHQLRKRSIFDVVLYQAGITLSGEFQQLDFQALNLTSADVHWNEARLAVGIQGMTGIKETVQLDWAGSEHRMEPGTGITGLLPSGVSTPVSIVPDGKNYAFSIPIKLNGSEYLSFEPVGKSTTVSLKSDWSSPSFEGAFLPDKRDITTAGFTAEWQVLDLNRAYPQLWKDDVVRFGHVRNEAVPTYEGQENPTAQVYAGSNIAVRLIKPVDEYLKNTRSAKYALLVIGLTFMLYFFFEMLRKMFIHPLQYLLVGLALTVFYLLLLSLSEHLGFNYAYFISAAATIALICLYSASVLRIRRLIWQLLAMLVAIYGFIFILLQLEDYALLAGSIGVFVALAAVMFSSRKVDWYNIGSRNLANEPDIQNDLR